MQPKTTTKKILLVDDDADYCEVIQTRLESAGFNVTRASDGAEAMVKLDTSNDVDLIIMDIDMPKQNGLTTLINLNIKVNHPTRRKAKKIPIMIATGLESDRIREIVEAQNVDDFLKKPFDAEVLLSKVMHLTDINFHTGT